MSRKRKNQRLIVNRPHLWGRSFQSLRGAEGEGWDRTLNRNKITIPEDTWVIWSRLVNYSKVTIKIPKGNRNQVKIKTS